jgi:threonine synthase
MSSLSTSAPGVRPADFRFRCIACGDVRDAASRDFRCAACGDLLEIAYPHWKEVDASRLKSAWSARRTSQSAIDLSGVWRFRELLPGLDDPQQAITLREGNTPLYELPQCARITGVPRLFAKHQGLNPTGSFKDTGMTVAATFAQRAGFRWVACAGVGAGREDFVEQAFASAGLRRGHVPVAQRF